MLLSLVILIFGHLSSSPLVPHLPPPFFSFLSVVSHTVQAMVRQFSLLREFSNLPVYTLDMAEFTLFGK